MIKLKDIDYTDMNFAIDDYITHEQFLTRLKYQYGERTFIYDETEFLSLFNNWKYMNMSRYRKMYASLSTNYDLTSGLKVNETSEKTQTYDIVNDKETTFKDTQTKSGSDSSINNNVSSGTSNLTNTNSISGYDSDTLVTDSKQIGENSNNVESENNTTVNYNTSVITDKIGNDTNTKSGSTTDNIVNTKNITNSVNDIQNAIERELKIRRYNINEFIINEFVELYTVW